MHTPLLACSLALARAGRSIAARIAIIAITTRSSINVKPFLFSIFSPPFLADAYERSIRDVTREITHTTNTIISKYFNFVKGGRLKGSL